MKIIGLDGKQYQLDIRQSSYPIRSEAACKSKFQFECGQILKEKFPHDVILEEVHVPRQGIILDFFLPTRKLVIESHGRQHDKFVQHFHGNIKNFKKSQSQDKKKEEWCNMNNIQYIAVRSVDELLEIIK